MNRKFPKVCAVGQEPGWLLEITNGVEILIVTNYGEHRTSYPYVEPIMHQEERRTEFIPGDDGSIVEIRGIPCRDSMSGEESEVSVTIKQGATGMRTRTFLTLLDTGENQ